MKKKVDFDTSDTPFLFLLLIEKLLHLQIYRPSVTGNES